MPKMHNQTTRVCTFANGRHQAFPRCILVALCGFIVTKKKIIGSQFADTIFLTDRSKQNTRVYGRGGDDQITATAIGIINYIYGEDGNDAIVSGSYTKLADGGEGDDDIRSYVASNHAVWGGAGNDRLSITWAWATKNGKDIVRRAVVNAGAGDDIIDYQQNNTNSSLKALGTRVFTGTGNDQLRISGITYSDKTRFDLGEGDDILSFLGLIPQSPQSYFEGGPGTDTFMLDYPDMQRQFLRLEQVGENVYSMVFNSWQIDGIGYEQRIQLSGFEKVSNGDEQINLTELLGIAELQLLGWL